MYLMHTQNDAMRMWQAVGPSKTKVSFRSYYWNSNFDGTNTRGEGTLNWKGTVTGCGGNGNAGIKCYGNTKGDAGFNNNPNGGTGCKKNLSGRWSSPTRWYVRPAVALAKTFLLGSCRHVSACACLFVTTPFWDCPHSVSSCAHGHPFVCAWLPTASMHAHAPSW